VSYPAHEPQLLPEVLWMAAFKIAKIGSTPVEALRTFGFAGARRIQIGLSGIGIIGSQQVDDVLLCVTLLILLPVSRRNGTHVNWRIHRPVPPMVECGTGSIMKWSERSIPLRAVIAKIKVRRRIRNDEPEMNAGHRKRTLADNCIPVEQLAAARVTDQHYRGEIRKALAIAQCSKHGVNDIERTQG
jgi:hypothetical protein